MDGQERLVAMTRFLSLDINQTHGFAIPAWGISCYRRFPEGLRVDSYLRMKLQIGNYV